MKKGILILTLLILVLFSVSCIYAADANDTIVASEDNQPTDDIIQSEIQGSDNDNFDEELTIEDSNADGLAVTANKEPTLSEGETTPGSFNDLNDLINTQYSTNSTITLDRNYKYNGYGGWQGIEINRPLTIDGAGHTLDGNNLTRIFHVKSVEVVFKNINFINGYVCNGDGAAIYLERLLGGAHDAINCNFTNNIVEEGDGGALHFINAYNCHFTNNSVLWGGAHGGAMNMGDAVNCTFIGNRAETGGALANGNSYNCIFINNTARTKGGAMYFGQAVNCTFIENRAEWIGGAIYDGIGIKLCIFEDNDYYGTIKPAEFIVSDLNTTRDSGERLLFNLTCDGEIFNGFNTTIKVYKNDIEVGTYYALSGEGWVVDLAPGIYKVVLSLDKYTGVSNGTATITVNKVTQLTASEVTTTYKVAKNLVITLKDIDGNPISDATVTVVLNGVKMYHTDKNGQIKVAVGKLVPKTYTAKISFADDDKYIESSTTAKVTVKKATPKITAKKKTFKLKVKTKKFTITLKDNTGKAIKNAKVTLKLKGKTYKATTNSKGKATFKITKLNKKGTFKAVITYKGNKYYKKVTKKDKIKVIVTFKTVSKGSKDKSTVREIQKALKDNGYYLSYKGHYLMVDGKFNSYTQRSVKEFQQDKGLKVTGKVDEKTAKKLGII